MILNCIKLPISKKIFTISKLDGRNYKENIGNFAKHLKKNNLSLDAYILKYYEKYVPRCLETGQPIVNRRSGYWNEMIPLSREFSKLGQLVKCATNTVQKIKQKTPEFYSEYLEFEYWINKKYTLSQAYKKISYFIKGDNFFYKRLTDVFYDDSWTHENKFTSIENILNLRADRLEIKFSERGIKQRGNVSMEEYTNYYKSRETIFRDPNTQKRFNSKRQEKYTSIEQRKFSKRCVEYWLNAGCDFESAILGIKDFQANNTIEAICLRYKCSMEEARTLQKSIYDRRAQTMSQKPLSERMNIFSRQDSSSYEYCLKKENYNIENALKLFNDLKVKKSVPLGRASKESLIIFIPLYNFLIDSGIKSADIYFGFENFNEYYLAKDKKFYMYDFTILSKKLIIEYDGAYWHGSDTAQVADRMKEEAAIEMGFAVLRIHSSDLNKFEKLNKFLYENIQITNSNWGIV